jgi:hypothetical protein
VILSNIDKKGRYDLLELNHKNDTASSIYLKGSINSKSVNGVYTATLGKLEERISDFEPLGDDKVVVLWSSGKLTLWNYGRAGCKIMSTFDLRNQVGFDDSVEYNTFSISKDRTNIIVASRTKDTHNKVAIHLLSLDNTGYIEYRSSKFFH